MLPSGERMRGPLIPRKPRHRVRRAHRVVAAFCSSRRLPALPSSIKLASVSFMPTPKSSSAAPLTFDLPVSLISKIARARRGHALGSVSEVVRLALEQFDLGSFQSARDPHVQISVRIAAKQRSALRHTAKRKDASVGEVIRAALEQLPEKPARTVQGRRRR